MRKLLVLLESGLLFVGLCVGLAAWQQQRALEQPLQLTEERLLDVSSGSTPGGMLARLEQEKVLHGAFWLRLYWRFNLPGQALHSGEYRLLPGMKGADLLELWREGEVVQYSLTLVEGWSFRQVREALARQGKLEQTLAGLSDGEIMQRLGKPDEVAEGRFFPDTYRYTRGMRDIDILRKAYQRMQTILAKEWDGRSQDLPYRDAYQALIMASLVEKETGVPEERSQIAGVFVRRLQRGMLLQTDPTVIYGMGERYNGKITRATCANRPLTIPMWCRACRRPRSPWPGARRFAPRCIRPRVRPCISWRAAMAAMCSPAAWTNTTRRSASIS